MKNIEEISFQHTVLFAAILLATTFIIDATLKLLLKKHYKQLALLIFAGWLLFWISIPLARHASFLIFNYLPTSILAYKWGIALFVCVACMAAIFIFLLKSKKTYASTHRVLNAFMVIISTLLFTQIIYTRYVTKQDEPITAENNTQNVVKRPNIYHILLDAYVNHDTLLSLYGYDNTAFYKELEGLEFQCFPQSYSNYSGTLLSMSSVLNFGCVHENKTDERSLLKKLRTNNVWNSLLKNGYKLHLLSQCDLYNGNPFVKNTLNVRSFTKACMVFIQNTILKHVIENMCLKDFYKQHVEEVYAIAQKLKDGTTAFGRNNQYFYAHFYPPHEPLVFDENGQIETMQTFSGFLVQQQTNILESEADRAAYKKRYINQIKAINAIILDTIKEILSQYSKEEQPIIILHGDHGRTLSVLDAKKHALSNLFAIHVPTPWRKDAKLLEFVNMYRFVLNHLFAQQYEYLPSRYFLENKEVFMQ